MLNNFYSGKKVFLTGHTGFKGVWLSLWLSKLGAEVCGYSLSPYTEPSMFKALNVQNIINTSIEGDILEEEFLQKSMKEFQPDIVFHLAAQSLVRLSYREPLLTYKTNVIGTLNVLEAALKCNSVKSFVNVTTDKCYENKETNTGYSEDDAMGGYDMYSSSKGCVEIMSSSYRRSFLQNKNTYKMATARSGNVIGGGDWALDRLIPDCIRSITENKDIVIRNPNSIRPWQYVLEPLSGYLLLGKLLYETKDKYTQGFNFGPYENSVFTVKEVVTKLCDLYGKGNIIIKPDNSLHENNLLMLNINKAKNILGWEPALSFDKALKMTVDWYKHYYLSDINMCEYTIKQIEEYEGNIKWKKNSETE